MDRFVSPPIEVPGSERTDFSRADLIFDSVDHSGDSFTAHVFLNNPEADETTPHDEANGYAGWFAIFGHGGCAGDVGHCDPPFDQTDPDDQRLLHPLTPHTKVVLITAALRRVTGPEVTVTVVAVVPGEDAPQRADVLKFESLELAIYD
jgi:tyrosinase